MIIGKDKQEFETIKQQNSELIQTNKQLIEEYYKIKKENENLVVMNTQLGVDNSKLKEKITAVENEKYRLY